MPNIQCKSITRNGCDPREWRMSKKSATNIIIPSKLFSVQFLVGAFTLNHSVNKNRGLYNSNNLSPLTSYLYRPLLNRPKSLIFCLIGMKYDIVMGCKELHVHVSCAFPLSKIIIWSITTSLLPMLMNQNGKWIAFCFYKSCLFVICIENKSKFNRSIFYGLSLFLCL